MPATTKKLSVPKKKVSKKVVTKSVQKEKEVTKSVQKEKEVTKSVQKEKEVINPEPIVTDAVAPVIDTVATYGEDFTHVLTSLRSLQTNLKELTLYASKLEKRIARDQKAVQKRLNGKRRRKTGTGQPSGFSKPGPVSDEMRTFLKLDKDELIARTQCTKRINIYCKERGLQNSKDKRILNADKPLRKLLRLGPKDSLTFFNLQKFMKIHFPNKEGVYPTA